MILERVPIDATPGVSDIGEGPWLAEQSEADISGAITYLVIFRASLLSGSLSVSMYHAKPMLSS